MFAQDQARQKPKLEVPLTAKELLAAVDCWWSESQCSLGMWYMKGYCPYSSIFHNHSYSGRTKQIYWVFKNKRHIKLVGKCFWEGQWRNQRGKEERKDLTKTHYIYPEKFQASKSRWTCIKGICLNLFRDTYKSLDIRESERDLVISLFLPRYIQHDLKSHRIYWFIKWQVENTM